MRVAMIGQKGVPALHGGVERHVEELAARLAARGHDVVVFTRPNYTDPSLVEHRGIRLISVPTIGTKHLEAFVHSFLCTIRAVRDGFDVVHYHAIGPCLVAPIARLRRRTRVVATIHGQDWRRAKWGAVARAVLRLGEVAALRVPHATICVSESLAEHYNATRRHAQVHFIPNGVSVCDSEDMTVLDELGVDPGQYILFAGRLVPEKGCHYLLEALENLEGAPPLVVAGDTSGSDEYVTRLRSRGNAIFAGYVYGPRLAALFKHCALFVLPSDLEGLPIVLLEAVRYGAPVLASDIEPNREVLGEMGRYFRAGDVEDLRRALRELLTDVEVVRKEAELLRTEVETRYDWDRVCEQTEAVYGDVVGERSR